MRLRFSEAAEVDLLEIGDVIAQDAPRRAISFVDELRQSCAGLQTFPLSGE